jgi:ketosteroid isomerase-like protein
MKRRAAFFVLASALVFLPVSLHGATSPQSKVAGTNDLKSKAEEEVRAVENRRVAFVTANQIDSLARLLSDDLTYTHANGVTQTKEQLLAPLRSGEVRYHSIEHEDLQIRNFGDATLLRGFAKIKVTSKGKDLELRIRFTAVYAKELGQWKLLVWQSTLAEAK